MAEQDEVLTLDEENELYGYAIMNVHQNCLIELGNYADVQSGAFDNDELVSTREDILEAYKRFASEHYERTGSKDLSAFRVVEVRLSNDIDSEAFDRAAKEVMDE